MVNHVLQLSLQAFLYACGSARDKGVCVLCLSTEMLEARLYSLPIVHVHTRLFCGIYVLSLTTTYYSKLVLRIVKMHMGDPRL